MYFNTSRQQRITREKIKPFKRIKLFSAQSQWSYEQKSLEKYDEQYPIGQEERSIQNSFDSQSTKQHKQYFKYKNTQPKLSFNLLNLSRHQYVAHRQTKPLSPYHTLQTHHTSLILKTKHKNKSKSPTNIPKNKQITHRQLLLKSEIIRRLSDKLWKEVLIHNHINRKQLQFVLQRYQSAGIEAKRWRLLVFDEIYKRVKDRYRTS